MKPHLIVIAAIAASCASKKNTANDTIKIGAVLSLSEDCSAGVDEMVEALKLGEKEINAAGGVLGKRIEIVIRDDTSDPEVAKQVFDELITKEKPVAIIGAVCSSVSKELIPLAQQHKVVLVSPSSTSPTLSALGADGYFFRTCVSDSEQGKLLAQQARTLHPDKLNAAVLHDRTAYGEGLRDAFKTAFESAGGNNVPAYGMATSEDANAEEASTATQGTFTATPRPDIVLLATFPTQADLVLGEFASRYIATGEANWLFPDALRVDSFADALKSSGSNTFKTTSTNHIGTGPGTPKKASFDAFVTRFHAEYDKNPNTGNYSPHAYDALYAIALAMQQGGASSGEAINDAMRGISTGNDQPSVELYGPERYADAIASIAAGRPINFDGVTTPVNFDLNGDTTGTFDTWKAIEGVFETIEQDVSPQ